MKSWTGLVLVLVLGLGCVPAAAQQGGTVSVTATDPSTSANVPKVGNAADNSLRTHVVGLDPTDTLGNSVALGSLNAAATVALAGRAGAGFHLAAGTLTGTVVPELSFDGGVTYPVATKFIDGTLTSTASIVLANPNGAQDIGIQVLGGATHARVRVSAYTSGTATGLTTATVAAVPIVAFAAPQHIIIDSAATQAVSGTVTVTQGTAANLKVDLSGTAANATAIKTDSSATTQPISAAALTSIDTKTPALGQALAAASVPVILPSATITTLTPPAAITGFALEAGHLATIDSHIPALGQALAAASLPVVLPAATVTTLTPPAAITGFALEAGHLATIDSHLPALGQALAAASIPVILPAATITTLTPPAAITGFALDATLTGRLPAGASPADAESNTNANLSRFGSFLFGYNGTTWDRLRGDTTNGLWVNIKAGAGSGGTAINDNTAFTAGTTATTPAAGFYHSTVDTVTDGRSAAMAIDSHRTLHIGIYDTSGNAVTPSSDATYNAAALTTGPQMMGYASAATPAAVSGDGNAQRLWMDTVGRAHMVCDSGCSGTTLGQSNKANSLPVTLAYDQGPIAVNNWQLNGWPIATGVGLSTKGTQRFALSLDSRVMVEPGANPLLVASYGLVNTAAPTYSDGQRAPLSLDTTGAIRVNVTSGSTGNAAAGATGSAVPAQGDYLGLNIGGTLRGQTGFSVGSQFAAGVAIVDGAGAQITSFGGGTQYANGSAQATPTGTVSLGWDGANVRALSTNASGQLNVIFPSAQAVSQSGAPWAENITQFGGGAVVTVATGVPKIGVADAAGAAFLSAANALNSTGSGVLAAQLVGQFDDVAPTAITENQFGNLRMSANRNAYTTLRDAAGNERGANVTAANELLVSVNNASLAVTQGTAANLNATVVQGNAGSNAQAWWTRIGDATNGPVAVKASSTAAGASDPALVVSFSPNSPIPAGVNVIGHVIADSGSTTAVTGTVAVTQSTSPWADNVSQFGGSNVVTGTGTGGAGIPRFTVSSDSSLTANIGTTNGLALDATLTARLPVIGPALSAYALPVTIAKDDPVFAALMQTGGAGKFSSAMGLRGSFGRTITSTGDALDVNVKYQAFLDPCMGSSKGSISVSQTTSSVALTGTAGRYVVCQSKLVGADAETISIVSGHGSVCGTGTIALDGATSAANGIAYAANSGASDGSGQAGILYQPVAGDDLCVLQNGSGRVSGHLTYAIIR